MGVCHTYGMPRNELGKRGGRWENNTNRAGSTGCQLFIRPHPRDLQGNSQDFPMVLDRRLFFKQ